MILTTALMSACQPIASAEVSDAGMSTVMPAGKMTSAEMTIPEVSAAVAAAEVNMSAAVSTAMTAAMTTAAATARVTANTLSP
jgi:post-segregation antitoxin (ccd killing protein)